MYDEIASTTEIPARVLAMMVAANGRLDERELRVLDEHDAFRRLRVSRQRFVDLVRACVKDVGANLCERSWLCAADETYADALLDTVADSELRLLICRLADAIIAAEGDVTHDERLIYRHALARWHISQERVTDATLRTLAA